VAGDDVDRARWRPRSKGGRELDGDVEPELEVGDVECLPLALDGELEVCDVVVVLISFVLAPLLLLLLWCRLLWFDCRPLDFGGLPWW